MGSDIAVTIICINNEVKNTRLGWLCDLQLASQDVINRKVRCEFKIKTAAQLHFNGTHRIASRRNDMALRQSDIRKGTRWQGRGGRAARECSNQGTDPRDYLKSAECANCAAGHHPHPNHAGGQRRMGKTGLGIGNGQDAVKWLAVSCLKMYHLRAHSFIFSSPYGLLHRSIDRPIQICHGSIEVDISL
jgi:hypothetical protein